jgi:leucyl/phenylalanyl-tRNA--protein transferase
MNITYGPSILIPDPKLNEDPEGIIAVGGKIDGPTLTSAYGMRTFPWPQRDGTLKWICPIKRGVLFYREYRPGKRTIKELRKSSWYLTFNRSFQNVIRECSEITRTGQSFTWITSDIIKGYSELHEMGYAHSIECRNSDNTLIGGMFGVFINGVFTGESMYHHLSGASKLCLVGLMEILHTQNINWVDTQIVSTYIGTVGGKLIDRKDYFALTENTKKQSLAWPNVWSLSE